MMKQTAIKSVLRAIYVETENNHKNHSLYTGASGVALFKVLYSKYFQNQFDPTLNELLQSIAESSFYNQNKTFAQGNSGALWLFSYLYKSQLISKQDYRTVCSFDNILKEESLSHIKAGNYDFLHGGVGIAYYVLYNNPARSKSYIRECIKSLDQLIDSDLGMIPSFDVETMRPDVSMVNIGLAHGIPSILKFCIESFNIYRLREAESLAMKIISYLTNHKNPDGLNSAFPNVISKDSPASESRLAWCYGDLTIAYMLYQASCSLSIEVVKDFSLNILINSTQRKSYDKTRIRDNSICHGNIGIAHIYNKAALITKKNIFKKECKYWIEKSLSEEPYDQGRGTRMLYNVVKGEYENGVSLLEGSSGFGLALISYLTQDFSWDYSLMLN